MKNKQLKDCPKCHSPDVIPILYGMPTPEAVEESEKALIKLGGCCVTFEDPQRYCKNCGNEF